MEKLILLDNEYAECSFINEYKLAHLKWKSTNISSTKYREAFEVLLEYTENTEVVNFISDGRLSGAINPDDRKWFQSEVLKRADKNGLKRGAIVIKADPFKKYYINQIVKWSSRNFNMTMKVFINYDEALNWLLSFNDYK